MNFDLSLVNAALAEDIGPGDATSLAIIPEGMTASAMMAARAPVVVCGVELAEAVFRQLAPAAEIKRMAVDGERVGAGHKLLKISADARALLAGERVALNFIQRLSGVATLTSRYVDAVKGTKAQILDTRKTTPGWRALEKYAVACGGGVNHRMGLHDRILIKDNHLAALRDAPGGAVAAAVARARAKYPGLLVEVEADTLEQAQEAVAAGADWILLDNMDNARLREAVREVAGRAKTEASGGVTLAAVRGIADTGVDFISVGALTHSAPAADIALDFLP